MTAVVIIQKQKHYGCRRQARESLVVTPRQQNIGYGGALRTGFKEGLDGHSLWVLWMAMDSLTLPMRVC